MDDSTRPLRGDPPRGHAGLRPGDLDALWDLLGELSSPDLTLGRAKVLRERLRGLLPSDDAPACLPAVGPDQGRGVPGLTADLARTPTF